VAKALRGARAVVVAGQPGPHLLQAAAAAKVEHLVLPSLAGTAKFAVAKLLKLSADAGCCDPFSDSCPPKAAAMAACHHAAYADGDLVWDCAAKTVTRE